MIDYKEVIKRNPNKRFGKPCLRDTRIIVFDVLGWLAAEMTQDQIEHDVHINGGDDNCCEIQCAH